MRIALVEKKSRDFFNIYSLFVMPRGIPLLAAILEREGHEVVCFVEDLQPFRTRDLLEFDAVGFGAIDCTIKPTLKAVKKLKKLGYNKPIIVAGPHPTQMPEESLSAGADFVVRHEGDIIFPELIRAFENKTSLSLIPGISWKTTSYCGTQFVNNIDRELLTEDELSNLPFPSFRSILGWEKLRYISISCSRGCPYGCEFCGVEAHFGRPYRFTTAQWRISQLEQFLADPVLSVNCSVFFTDDNLIGTARGKKTTIDTLQMIISKNLVLPKGWYGQMRVEDAKGIVPGLLEKAGCKLICHGVESLNDATLHQVGKHQTAEDIKTGIQNLRRHNIPVMAMMIAGLGNDSFKTFFEGIKKLHSWGASFLQVLFLVPLVGTKLTKRLDKEKVRYSKNYDRRNGMHYILPNHLGRIKTWLSVYYSMGWFYWKKSRETKKHKKDYWKMAAIILKQLLQPIWFYIFDLFDR